MLNLLTKEEIEDIQEDVRDILEDPDYNVPIIYRRLVSRSPDLGTGAVVAVHADTLINAFRGDMGAREAAASGGTYRLGDEFFMFAPEHMDADPRPDDRILREITREGYVKLVNGSAALVGYNTLFMIDGVHGGDMLVIDTDGAPVATIITPSSDELATLKANWTGTSNPAVQFKIYRVYSIVHKIVDPLKAACRLIVRRLAA